MVKREPLRERFKDILDFCFPDKRIDPKTQDTRAYTSRERQRMKGVRDELITALEDLSYFAKMLPEEHLQQVFTRGRIEPFIRNILKIKEERDEDWSIERRRYEIAAMLVENALDKCFKYLQDRDIDLMQLAMRDLHQAELWAKVAGSMVSRPKSS